jgi:hypothetical protein
MRSIWGDVRVFSTGRNHRAMRRPVRHACLLGRKIRVLLHLVLRFSLRSLYRTHRRLARAIEITGATKSVQSSITSSRLYELLGEQCNFDRLRQEVT